MMTNIRIYKSYTISIFITIMSFFFFNDTATTEIYTLSLHDALPILNLGYLNLMLKTFHFPKISMTLLNLLYLLQFLDRKSTRLNSSHANISYAVFCLKKKNIIHKSLLMVTSFYYMLCIIHYLHLLYR